MRLPSLQGLVYDALCSTYIRYINKGVDVDTMIQFSQKDEGGGSVATTAKTGLMSIHLSSKEKEHEAGRDWKEKLHDSIP